jgi:hypothetical protein
MEVDYTLSNHIMPSLHPLWMPLILPICPLYRRVACCLVILENFEARFDERLVDSTVVVDVVGTDVVAPKDYCSWGAAAFVLTEGGSLLAAFVASQVPTLFAHDHILRGWGVH